MDLSRSTLTAAATSSVVTALTTAAVTTVVTRALRARRHGPVQPRYRTKTGGCTPDTGPYLDNNLVVHNVDGTHQGIAITMLRNYYEALAEHQSGHQADTEADAHTQSAPSGDPEESSTLASIIAASSEAATIPIDNLILDYEDGLRSIVEVTLAVALDLSEQELDLDHECEDGCEVSQMGPATKMMWLSSTAAQYLLRAAFAYERFNAEHSADCRRCRKAGLNTPPLLAARFCRELAEDLLTNDYDEHLRCHGIPVETGLDIIRCLMALVESEHGLPVDTQIDRLSRGVASSIRRRETDLT